METAKPGSFADEPGSAEQLNHRSEGWALVTATVANVFG